MLDKPLVAFDIETVPDPDIGRRASALAGTDAEVVRAMVDKRREETDGRTDYPHSPFHRIVCACVTIVRLDRTVEVRRLGDDDERTTVDAFYRLARELEPRLVSWNGGGFDLPVLRYRAMLHGVTAPGFYRYDKDPRIDGYVARYGNMHVDVMDLLSSHGASPQAGLATVSRLLGLPGKGFLERAVWEHWVEGDRGRIVEYCKLDTVLTTLIFLAWLHHAGHADRPAIEAIAASLRAAISGFEGWNDIAARLEGWPRWPA